MGNPLVDTFVHIRGSIPHWSRVEVYSNIAVDHLVETQLCPDEYRPVAAERRLLSEDTRRWVRDILTPEFPEKPELLPSGLWNFDIALAVALTRIGRHGASSSEFVLPPEEQPTIFDLEPGPDFAERRDRLFANFIAGGEPRWGYAAPNVIPALEIGASALWYDLRRPRIREAKRLPEFNWGRVLPIAAAV